jgi:hypothetical protein
MEWLHTRARSLALVSSIFAILVAAPAAARDNDGGPLPDEDALCEAANVLCQESCDGAKYTSAQRGACGNNCKSAYDRCVQGAAARINRKGTVGNRGTTILRK